MQTLPAAPLVVPAWMICTMAGWRGRAGVWPAVLICGGTFAGCAETRPAANQTHQAWPGAMESVNRDNRHPEQIAFFRTNAGGGFLDTQGRVRSRGKTSPGGL
ncbi:MAG: hypothetical protein WD060_13495 [Pirellulales bacterium]